MTMIMYTQSQIMELVRQHAIRTQGIELIEGNHSIFYNNQNGSLTISTSVAGNVTADDIVVARPEIDAEVERTVTNDTVRATVTGNEPSPHIGMPDIDTDFAPNSQVGPSRIDMPDEDFGFDNENEDRDSEIVTRRVHSLTPRVRTEPNPLLDALENHERANTDNEEERIVTTRPIIEHSDIPEQFRGEATGGYEIEELMEWAVENQQLVKIVYTKRNRGEERSARVITPLAVEGQYLRTHLHCTLVEGVGELVFTAPDDNFRSFIIGLIERAELFGI